MHLPSIFALVSGFTFSSFVPIVAAQFITADSHSFGGVSFPLLQYYRHDSRDEIIRAIVKSKARVIRLHIQPDSHHNDPEVSIGEFDKSLLDQFDDTLAAIYRISEGQVKVVIAPHDAHALRGTNDVPCDAYCKKLGGAFLDFYSLEQYRTLYKTRLDVFFKHYPSKNFGGRNWNELSEVIMGVDIQNQPFSGIWPIPAGESWLCDIANHLKFSIGLDNSNIAVISGGISGFQSLDGIQNFPDSAFECSAIDVIGIHGRLAAGEGATAGTSWAEIFVPGNTLTARAQGKAGKRKLLLVEEWDYVHTDAGLEHKREAIFDQGNALNLRGIPWIFSHLSSKNESTTSMINPLLPEHDSMTALTDVLTRASVSRSSFDWSSYLPAPTAPLSNITEVPLNPYIPPSSPCTFGCEGHLCSTADGCAPNLLCKNLVCQRNPESQPGQAGSICNSKKPCQSHLHCSAGFCQPCSVRPTLPGTEMCAPDAITALYTHPSRPPTCLSTTGRRNPCENAGHCSANEYCSWGLCTACKDGDACLGAPCKSNNSCKTGYCNDYGRCDYGGKKKLIFGPGIRGRWKNRRVDGIPQGHERGPAKVRSEALRVVIPTEEVMETGQAKVIS